MSFVRFDIQNLTTQDVRLHEFQNKLVPAGGSINLTLRREKLTDPMLCELEEKTLRRILSVDTNIAPSNTDLVARIRGARDEANTNFYDRTIINVLAAQSVQAAIDELAISGSLVGVIGTPSDGTYDDGLFPFTPTTTIANAVDAFNELLLELAPPPAPDLTSIGFDQVGEDGKLSFGASNGIAGYTSHPTLDVNDVLGNTGNDRGILNATTPVSGTLADDVAAHPFSYPANAFGNGEEGFLILEVNGVDVHQVSLVSFVSGVSQNGNGSGFNLSAAQSVEFDNGQELDLFRYRTGTWNVAVAELQNGYNEIRVIHEVSVTDIRPSQTFVFVVDDATLVAIYALEQLHSLAMTGSDQLSGVTYHNSGTALYDVVIQNAYRNTFQDEADAISHPGTLRASLADQAIPDIVSTEADLIVIDDKTVNITTSQRVINQGIFVNTRVDRTVQTDVNSTGVSAFNLLVDPFITDGNSTNTQEVFDDEEYRIQSDVDILDTGYGSGPSSSPANWDSSESLVGADAGHNDGLLEHDGALRYPTNAPFSGDFTQVVDGPVGNVDYSSASGLRTYLRYFPAPDPRANFNLSVTATNTNFVPVSTGPSGNNLTLEILAPNSTQNGVGVVEFKDGIVPYTNDDDIGAFAATFGNNIPTDIGLTIGTKTTATAGDVLVIRITASAAWTGQIDQLTLTFL